MAVLKVLTAVIFIALLNLAFARPKLTWDACPHDDQPCLLHMMQSVKQLIAEGVPELGIPRLDPMQIDDIYTEVPEFLKLHVKDSLLRGPQTCIYDYSRFDFRAHNATLAVQCNLATRGHYEATIYKPIMVGIPLSHPIQGNGTFTLALLNTRLLFDFTYDLVKDKDGVIRIRYLDGKTSYDVNHKNHIGIFSLTGLRNGDEDISEAANESMNKNWKVVSTMLVTPYIQKTVNKFIRPELTYFLKMPASNFISGDLNEFVTVDESV